MRIRDLVQAPLQARVRGGLQSLMRASQLGAARLSQAPASPIPSPAPGPPLPHAPGLGTRSLNPTPNPVAVQLRVDERGDSVTVRLLPACGPGDSAAPAQQGDSQGLDPQAPPELAMTTPARPLPVASPFRGAARASGTAGGGGESMQSASVSDILWARREREFEFAVEVAAGPPSSMFRHTKVVTVKARYIIDNQTGGPIEVKQLGTPDLGDAAGGPPELRCAARLAPNERVPLHWDDRHLPREVVCPQPCMNGSSAAQGPQTWPCVMCNLLDVGPGVTFGSLSFSAYCAALG